MKNNPHMLRFGLDVFLETPPRRHGEPSIITHEVISRVGTKYFYLQNSDHRYYVDTLLQDGKGRGDYLGAVYPTKFLLEQAQTRHENLVYIDDFCRNFSASTNNDAIQALKDAMVQYKTSGE